MLNSKFLLFVSILPLSIAAVQNTEKSIAKVTKDEKFVSLAQEKLSITDGSLSVNAIKQIATNLSMGKFITPWQYEHVLGNIDAFTAELNKQENLSKFIFDLVLVKPNFMMRDKKKELEYRMLIRNVACVDYKKCNKKETYRDILALEDYGKCEGEYILKLDEYIDWCVEKACANYITSGEKKALKQFITILETVV